jgi:hypothetical protein
MWLPLHRSDNDVGLVVISVRLSGYLTVFAEEWLLVLLIWLALRHRGFSLGGLVSGRRQNLGAFKDFGLAVGFLLVLGALLMTLTRLFGGPQDHRAHAAVGYPALGDCYQPHGRPDGGSPDIRVYLSQAMRVSTHNLPKSGALFWSVESCGKQHQLQVSLRPGFGGEQYYGRLSG